MALQSDYAQNIHLLAAIAARNWRPCYRNAKDFVEALAQNNLSLDAFAQVMGI